MSRDQEVQEDAPCRAIRELKSFHVLLYFLFPAGKHWVGSESCCREKWCVYPGLGHDNLGGKCLISREEETFPLVNKLAQKLQVLVLCFW